MEVIVGTWNQGKLNEMQEALASIYPEVHLVGIEQYLTTPVAPAENGETYYDNALEKARFYSALLKNRFGRVGGLSSLLSRPFGGAY